MAPITHLLPCGLVVVRGRKAVPGRFSPRFFLPLLHVYKELCLLCFSLFSPLVYLRSLVRIRPLPKFSCFLPYFSISFFFSYPIYFCFFPIYFPSRFFAYFNISRSFFPLLFFSHPSYFFAT